MTEKLSEPSRPVDAAIRASRQALLEWYDRNGRNLPWRAKGQERANPYHVWLSEIMLQQTTVAHAIPYFEKFIRLWPTIEDLAREQDEALMAQWAGLGYYARARNMLKCARIVCEKYRGLFPDNYQSLRALPGIGDYTASAILSVAYGKVTNVVDANIERIMSRLYAVDAPISEAKKQIYTFAASWLMSERVRDWPQALMDLASLICRPAMPQCVDCPLYNICYAQKSGFPQHYPRKKKRPSKPLKSGHVYVIFYKDQVWVEPRPKSGLLGGMMGLPHTDWSIIHNNNNALKHMFYNWNSELMGHFKHTFTHFELVQNVHFINISDGIQAQRLKEERQGVFLSLENIETLPTVFKKAVKLVMTRIRIYLVSA